MSEYQFIHFLAIDRPLDEEQLEFMRGQSSRAEVSRWEFTNEYHFGDFHGNTLEMLRRGYDVHLHFADFGIRRLMFRLPGGLPCQKTLFRKFQPSYGLQWHADRSGPGGTLDIQPEGDAGTWDAYLPDVEEILPSIAPVRDLLMQGDLRPLYLAWLACELGCDESVEPSVPAGLKDLPPSLTALAQFYDISGDLLQAVALASVAAPTGVGPEQHLEDWLKQQSAAELRKLAHRLLAGDTAAARADVLTRVRNDCGESSWPVTESSRTIAEFRAEAERIASQRRKQEQAREVKQHQERQQKLAANPDKAIALARSYVKQRGTISYELAARELADLREALNSEQGNRQVAAVAEKLARDNPTLNRLKSALRKKGLLPGR
ncbi:MAG: hypothetical protein RIK87_02270 [Fuerstiella sp.]